MEKPPILASYWVQAGKLLAGQHPGVATRLASQNLRRLLEVGVSVFIDLTPKDEYYEYKQFAELEASRLHRMIAYYRFGIADNDVPSLSMMCAILDTIDTAILANRTVYVHCMHGTGRTGTVIGCYLARHGTVGEAALTTLHALRQGTINDEIKSPRHKNQQTMVLNWKKGV